MASSFAITNGADVVLQQGIDYAMSGTEVSGSGSTSAPQIGGVSVTNNFGGIAKNAMMAVDAINKLTDGALRGYLEETEKVQYHEGMTKVVQGQTLEQIKEDDPWYMNIMGPSATVRGAQAMVASTSIQQAETEMLQSMPQDRELSPDQYRAKLRKKYLELGNTGDPMVDMVVQSKFAEANGSLAKSHMQNHMMFQQEQAFSNFTNNNASIADTMRARRANSPGRELDPIEAENDRASAIEAFKAPPGMSRDQHSKAGIATLQVALQKGNFDYYNAIKGSPEWAKLDVRARETLEQHYDNAVLNNAHTDPALSPMANSMARFEFNISRGTTGIDDEGDFNAYLDSRNDEHARSTGATSPLIDNKRRATLIQHWYSGRDAAARRLAAATEKSAEHDRQYNATRSVVTEAFVSGRADNLRGLTLDPKGVVDASNAAFDTEYGSGDVTRMSNWAERAAATSHEDKLRSPKAESILRVGGTGLLTGNGPLTEPQKQAFALAQVLYSTTNGPEALSNYMGSADAAKMIGLINSGVDMNDPKGMDDQRERIRKGGAAVASSVEHKAVKATVMKADSNWFKGMFGADQTLRPYELTDDAKSSLADKVAPRAAQYAKAYGMSIEQATRVVMPEVLRNSDLIGGALITRQSNAANAARTLSGEVNRLAPGAGNQATSVYQKAANTAVMSQFKSRLEASGNADMANYDERDFHIIGGTGMPDGSVSVFVAPKDQTRAARDGHVQILLRPQAVVDEIKRADQEAATRKLEEPRKQPVGRGADVYLRQHTPRY